MSVRGRWLLATMLLGVLLLVLGLLGPGPQVPGERLAERPAERPAPPIPPLTLRAQAWNRSVPYLALLRVPKVGSKSLVALLRRVAPQAPGFCVTHGPTSCRRYASCGRMTLPAPRRLARAAVLQPHAAWDELHALLGARPARYLTFLRHPVARVVSEYKHVASPPGSKCAWDYRAYARLPLTTANCLEYVRDARNAWGTRNRQTRMLAGANITKPSEMLQVAIQHLREMDFVGLTERYDESITVLGYFLQRNMTEPKKVLEANDGVSLEITQELRDTILEANDLDLLLYEEAERILDIQLARVPKEVLPIGD